MKFLLNKINEHLNAYLRYDWQAFNDLGIKEQDQEWNRFEHNFKNLIEKEGKKD